MFQLVFLLFWYSTVSSAHIGKKIHVNYPVEYIAKKNIISRETISGVATSDKFLCLANDEYIPPSYKDAAFCLFHMLMPFEYNCESVWGSRSISVDVIGGLEIFKLNKMPAESIGLDFSSQNATKWLDLQNLDLFKLQSETRIVPSEPLYFCLRSNSWRQQQVDFNMTFRYGNIRSKDRELSGYLMIVHVILLIAISSEWLLPYIISAVVAFYVFTHGIKMYISCCVFSGLIVSLTPIMLTAKNRHLAGHYLAYFLPGVKEAETIDVFRRRLPVFQAVYFSSICICIGSVISYSIYSCFGLDRDIRNTLLKATLAIAASWMMFFVCRSFERFIRDWIWVALSIALTQKLSVYVNPMCHDAIIISIMTLTFVLHSIISKACRICMRFPSLFRLSS